MALLKHPLTRLGLDAFAVRRAARALEIAAFRDVYLGRGLDGVAAALERAERDRQRAGERRDRGRRSPVAGGLGRRARSRRAAAGTPSRRCSTCSRASGEQPLQSIAAAHVAAAEALAACPKRSETSRPRRCGRAKPAPQPRASSPASSIRSCRRRRSPPPTTPISIAASSSAQNVRPRVAVHPRLFIWGPFEARLQQTDVIILGSLNDGTWPEAADPGPWLNRPMRRSSGLPSPEEKIGHAAHDFTSLLGAERVYMTRAEKIDGVPTVPSRWLMRLKALLAGMGVGDALQPDQPWLGWARARDRTRNAASASRAPEPRPPLELRPRKMSVTRIETWLANPYAIFARDILRLEQAAAARRRAGRGAARQRRARDHEPLRAALSRRAAGRCRSAELMAIARDVLADYASHPRVAAFWLPRFERFAAWFAETEPARREGVARVVAEVAAGSSSTRPAGRSR